MRKRQFAALLVIGTFVLFLGRVPSKSLQQLAEKPRSLNTPPTDPEKAPEEPKRDGGIPQSKLEPANVAPASVAPLPKEHAPLLRERDNDRHGKSALSKLLRDLKGPNELKLANGRADYKGEVAEREEPYQDKKAYTALTVRLEAGKSYQIDHTSRVFQAFLYLEGPDGNRLKEHSSPTIGGNSRIAYRAERSGVYRVIATSLGGFRSGPFACSVSVEIPAYGLPKALAVLFRELDEDGDGQIGLYEWKGSAAEFREYDLNGDGFITPDELLRYLKKER